MSSDHVDLAERVPRFRFQTLSRALKVTGGKGARYSWESTENGDEGTPPGPWMYEIHHIAIIALECWTHFLYTQDMGFLEETAYPVIRECAEYFRLWHVYEIDEEKAMIGACTDLDESIFPVRNPIYSSCSAICAFSIAAKASQMLGVDEELRLEWGKLAEKLANNLPRDEERYVPFLGAEHQSLGSLGVLFPFQVCDPGDEKARKTVFDYRERCRSTTNWKGGSTSAYEGQNWIWNTAWLATCLARMDEGELAYDALKKAVSSTDTFGSVNEARTGEKTYHPWFTTGAGAYVYALNEMLVQPDPDEIKLLPALPSEWDDVSFKLKCQGNVLVEAKIANGTLQELSLESPVEAHRRILIPKLAVSEEYEALGGELKLLGSEDAYVAFQAFFKGSLVVRAK